MWSRSLVTRYADEGPKSDCSTISNEDEIYDNIEFPRTFVKWRSKSLKSHGFLSDWLRWEVQK